MSPSQTAKAPEVGPKLFDAGCRQGALIDLPARVLWLARTGESNPWSVAEDTAEGDQLVVVSQDCDIYASAKSEPRIEAISVRWTSNASEIHTARKGNSARLFLLREDGGKGLVADARRRVQLDKVALFGTAFKPALADARSCMRFANWVAGRYNRPAIPNDLVDAVQKPIVTAVDELARKDAPLLRVLENVAEIRFAVGDTRPWTVHLVVMVEDGDELGAEQEAELAGWLDDILVKQGGPIAATAPLFRTEKNISLHDYQSTTRLQLDHFTPEDETSDHA